MRYLSKLALLNGNTLTVFIHLCRIAKFKGIKEFGFKNCDLATALGISDNCVRKALSDLVQFGLIVQKKEHNANYVKLIHQEEQPKQKQVKASKPEVKVTDEEWANIARLINANLPVKVDELGNVEKEAIADWLTSNSLDKLYNVLIVSGKSRYIQEAANMDILLCLKLADRIIRGEYSCTAAIRKNKGVGKTDSKNVILNNLDF